MKTRFEKNKKIWQKINREEHQKKLKKFVKITSIIFITIFSILFYGMFIGTKVTSINEYKITNNLIPNSFHGINVVHISDILYDSLKSKDLTILKNKINNLEADILIFTGDIKKNNYNLSKKDINTLENFFKNLNAKIIKYAVVGDNDDESFSLIMENSNFKVLNNYQDILYYEDNTPINIIGIDSNNINLENIKNDKYYSICIFHNPDKIDNILKSVNCNLALAGDNLGGEIKFPFIGGILTEHKYNNNYYKFNQTEFYISNGLGNNHKIRLFNHPSINLYRLTNY